MTKSAEELDAIVIGAGFSGIYMLHKLREMGLRTRVFEAGEGVGGAWYWNRYPGARCDSESYFYCFFFSDEILQEWTWSERFPAQPEIERYLNFVTDRLDLRKDMTFNSRVTSAVYDEETKRWTVEASTGEKATARYVVTAIGGLTSTATNLPNIPGIEDFKGEWYHTGNWPKEGVDFSGKRVGVIGTGSTGIQAVPEIAKTAKHLTVFQRTPAYIMPAKNHPLSEEYVEEVKANYPEIKEKVRSHWGGQPYDAPAYSFKEVSLDEAERLQEEYWNNGGLRVIQLFKEGTQDPATREFTENFFREKVRSIVKDPVKAEILEPKGYPMGAKRIALDTNYYETFNLPHVDVVNVKKTPITNFTETGVMVGGKEYPIDILVLATGYDAVTGPFRKMDIRGRGGIKLAERLEDGPRAYLGMSFAGFPNLLAISGPCNPALSTNVPASIEHDVEWIADLIEHCEKEGFAVVEPTQEAEDEWTEETQTKAVNSVFTEADSWQFGSNVPGKPRRFLIWLGGLHKFRERCKEVTDADYAGFKFTR